jgi:ORF6N domain
MELDNIQSKIFDIRNQKVILDVDLAKLYATETSQLKRAVRRNMDRFPEDFMFQLTKEECNSLLNNRVCQFGTPQYNFSAYLPFAFTEQGVAMLSSVLRSDIAIKINISIMRAFVTVRNILQNTNTSLLEFETLKKRIEQIELGFDHVILKLENVEEDVLKITNDISEDIRTELDDIYIVLNELASSKAKKDKRNPIGFIQHDSIQNNNEQ